jgi:hypothetical protein
VSFPGAYPSPSERDARFGLLVEGLGGALTTVGHSVEGRPILAASVGAAVTSNDPALLVVGNIHGPEFVSSQVALACLELCSSRHPAWSALMQRARITVLPCLNPDGYARTYDARGRGSLSALRANANGVDLNRNYPLPAGARRWPIPGTGSAKPGAVTYRGTGPLSEPETSALAKLAQSIRPHASVGLHSFMGRLIPARVVERSAYAAYGRLCRAFAAGQTRWKYRRLSSRLFDVYTGEQEDYLHHQLGCWSVCVETYSLRASYGRHARAPSLFARFNPEEPAPWAHSDALGVAAYFAAALKMPRAGN